MTQRLADRDAVDRRQGARSVREQEHVFATSHDPRDCRQAATAGAGRAYLDEVTGAVADDGRCVTVERRHHEFTGLAGSCRLAVAAQDLGKNDLALDMIKTTVRALDGDDPAFCGGEDIDDLRAEGLLCGLPDFG